MESFKKIAVTYKIAVGFIPAIIILVIFTFYNIGFLKTVNVALDSASTVLEEFSIFSNLKTISSAISSTVGTYALTGKDSLEKRYDDLSATFDASLAKASDIVTDTEAKKVLADFKSKVTNLRGTELLIVTETRANNKAKAADLLEKYYIPTELEAHLALDNFTEQEKGKLDKLISNLIQSAGRIVKILSVIILPVILAILIIFYLFLRQFVINPIKNLAEATQRLSRHDYGVRAKIFYPDEIGMLAQAFNTMTENVEKSKKTLELKLEESVAYVDKIDSLLKKQAETLELLKRREKELTSANEQLQRLDNLKTEFLSVAAHQLRTPLTAIRWSFTESLNEKMGKINEEQRRMLEDGFQSTVLAVNLINELLDIARIDEGKLVYITKKQSIVPIVIDVVNKFKKEASYKKVSLALKLSEKPIPDISLDSEKITGALDNVLDNAVRYSKSGGEVSVSLEYADEKISIQIDDCGIGIPENQLKNIFTKFFRADNALLFQTTGSGLGLYVAKKIIEGHGGEISLKNRKPDGLSVIISLPTTEKKAKKQKI